jgi:hypothetical protein
VIDPRRPTSVPAALRSIGRYVASGLLQVEHSLRSAGAALVDRWPALTTLLVSTWYGYTHLYCWGTGVKNSLVHPAGIDPFEIQRVALDQPIPWLDLTPSGPVTSQFSRSKFKYAGRVMDGDWDQHTVPFQETAVYRGFEAHFERGVDWAETAFFADVMDRIDDGNPMWGCRSRAAFERRCERIDELYASIEAHGYRSQAELAGDEVDDPLAAQRVPSARHTIHDEMTVLIGRDGEYVFVDGRDRLAIVLLLDLPSVPVWVLARHERWQRLRDAVASGRVERCDLPPRLRDHPDLPT